MVFLDYTKRRIVFFHETGLRPTRIQRALAEEGIRASIPGISKFICHYQRTRTISRQPGSRQPGKLTAAVRQIINEQIEHDDETTATQLQKLLAARGHSLSLRTIQRSRTKCGWTFRGSAYCQTEKGGVGQSQFTGCFIQRIYRCRMD